MLSQVYCFDGGKYQRSSMIQSRTAMSTRIYKYPPEELQIKKFWFGLTSRLPTRWHVFQNARRSILQQTCRTAWHFAFAQWGSPCTMMFDSPTPPQQDPKKTFTTLLSRWHNSFDADVPSFLLPIGAEVERHEIHVAMAFLWSMLQLGFLH